MDCFEYYRNFWYTYTYKNSIISIFCVDFHHCEDYYKYVLTRLFQWVFTPDFSANLINAVTNSKLTYPEEGDEIDMCKAIDDMRADAKAEGRAEGKTESLVSSIKNVMDSIHVSIEEAMDILKVDPQKRQEYAAKVKWSSDGNLHDSPVQKWHLSAHVVWGDCELKKHAPDLACLIHKYDENMWFTMTEENNNEKTHFNRNDCCNGTAFDRL